MDLLTPINEREVPKMPPSSDLVQIMSYIGAHYTFTPEHYPPMKEMAPDRKKAFAVSHISHHMCKSIGKIATVCEHHDHGDQMDHDVLKEAAVKLLINAIKLAEELGLTAQDLANSVPHHMKK